MLLYIMQYIVLAYLMLFAALADAVFCIMLLFLPLISANAFYFHVLSLFIDTQFAYFIFLICVMQSAFNLFVFPNYMFTTLLLFFLFL